jgi:hypothetical protein
MNEQFATAPGFNCEQLKLRLLWRLLLQETETHVVAKLIRPRDVLRQMHSRFPARAG